jgi:hypothetical protein
MAKQYPLAVENIGEDVWTFMSKGHHDIHQFMLAVDGWCCGSPLMPPVHLWFRAVPTRDSGYRCRYVEASQGDRGAFPATYTHEAGPTNRYVPLAQA